MLIDCDWIGREILGNGSQFCATTLNVVCKYVCAWLARRIGERSTKKNLDVKLSTKLASDAEGLVFLGAIFSQVPYGQTKSFLCVDKAFTSIRPLKFCPKFQSIKCHVSSCLLKVSISAWNHLQSYNLFEFGFLWWTYEIQRESASIDR